MLQRTLYKLCRYNYFRIYGFCFIFTLLIIGISLVSFLPIKVFGVENNPPTVDSATIALSSGGASTSSVNLAENSATVIYIHGTATDSDGCSQIDNVSSPSIWKVAFYRTTVSNGENCSANNLNCYQDTEVNTDLTNCAGGADVDISYEMDISVQYYADATDSGSSPDYSDTTWTAYVSATDDNGGIGTLTTTVEINTLRAIETTGTINYGSVELGGTSAEQTIIITNTGNDNDLDPMIRQNTDWTCAVGAVATEYTRWNTTQGQGYASGTAMTLNDVDLNNISVAKSNDGSSSSANVYMMLQMPSTGVGGSCSSAITFTAA